MSTDPTASIPSESDPTAPQPAADPSPWGTLPTAPIPPAPAGAVPGAVPPPPAAPIIPPAPSVPAAPVPTAGPYDAPAVPAGYGGYPQQPGPVPPVGYAPPAGYAPAYGAYAGAEHPQGTIVLVLGILGIVVCGVLAPVAWFMGRKALREVDTSGQSVSNRGQLQAGMVCGIVGTVLWGLGILLYVGFFVFVFGMAATGAGAR